jgi:hypothetical protein
MRSLSRTADYIKLLSKPWTFFLFEREVFILLDFYCNEVISDLMASKWSLKLYNTVYSYYIMLSATVNYEPKLYSSSLTFI